jgi:hypothetical protein
MNMTRDRVQSIGWFTLLAVCTVLTGILVLRVNAVKSQVQITERQIIALKRGNQFLETEYETRANQQQLARINDLELGYKAPDAGQYLENERQLASLGKPREADAPAPIRMANADVETGESAGLGAPALAGMVPGLTGKLVSRAVAADVPAGGVHAQVSAANLRQRLSRVDPRLELRGESE